VYIPTHFEQTDLAVLHDFIERNSFALLCSTGEDGCPFASHLPLLLERRPGPFGALIGHMARANPQWRHADGKAVLAVFSGPHAYVSPSWYEADNVVPTWNYVAVHATGILRAIHDRDALLKIVADSVEVYERSLPAPWRLPLSGDYLERMLRGIVGFRVEIARLEGKWKLSQNHPEERREKVVRGLRRRGGRDEEAIADLMEP
jgi:transcriptional regulator